MAMTRNVIIIEAVPVRLFASGVVIDDFNADARLDVAVGTQTAGSRRVAVLFGSGSRTFSAPSYFGSFESSPTALGVGDFNRDGKLDLAAGGGANVPPNANNLS